MRSDVRNPSTIGVLRFFMADSFERVFSVIFSTATFSLNHKRRRKQTPPVNREFIGLGCFGRVISGLLKVVYINSYYYEITKMLFDLKICIHLFINNAHIRVVSITVKYATCLFRIKTYLTYLTVSDGGRIGFLRP